MSKDLAINQPSASSLMPQIMESVLMSGDLSKLSAQGRVDFYDAVCKSLGLNPLTRPFDYILLNGKLTLYAKKECSDQLRFIHNVSVVQVQREIIDGILTTTAHVRLPSGREDQDVGCVNIEGLKGEAKSNAVMKSLTKAKRRATLSICGLSMPDESEIDSIRDARRGGVDIETGKLIEAAKEPDTGGHPTGTQAAADAVAQRKIAEIKRQEPATSKNYQMMKAFEKIKAELGDEAYYRILGANGYEHCNEITETNKAKMIYIEMEVERRKQLNRQQEAKQEHIATDADLPAEMFAEPV